MGSFDLASILNDTDISKKTATIEPYYFTEEMSDIQGAVHNIITILFQFEPMDVLNGKTIVYDSIGRKILFMTEDLSIIERNEYPVGYDGIALNILEIDTSIAAKIKEINSQPNSIKFLDKIN